MGRFTFAVGLIKERARATGDNVYRDAVIRISELAGEQGVLEGFVFESCDLKDPAVVVPQGSNFASSRLVGDPDVLLWEIPPNRPEVIGAILVRNCTFEACTFMNVGFAGAAELVEQVRQSLGSSLQSPRRLTRVSSMRQPRRSGRRIMVAE